ncbi:MAG: DUF11 domain-containing protein [Clostridia bacterium]|nr:DUF11 domain-containing protein [Clostridia bacterium]
MKSKVMKKIFAILVIISMILPNLSTVLAVVLSHTAGTSNTQNFKISENFSASAEYWYKVNDRKVYRTYIGENDYSNAIYCLDMTAKFPTETTSTDTSTTGNYTCEGDVAISSKSGTDITNKIQIIADNMYIEGKTNLDEFLKDVFVDEFGQLEDPDYIFYGKTEEELLSEIKAAINVNDIFFAQQLAIWNYTNDLNSLSINYSNDQGNNWNGASNYSFTEKENKIKEIRNYLINKAENSSSTISHTATKSVWEATSGNNMQKLLYVTKKEYDAALSKTIIGIKKSGENNFTSPTENREKGAIEKDSSKSAGEDKHTKSDLPQINVSAGDQIKYSITVYNQGDENVKIKKIKDYLPDGLKLAENQENWSSGTTTDGKKYVVTTYWKDTTLYTEENKNVNEGKNSKLSIDIICEVESNAIGILKNYAEIAEMTNEENYIVDDIDSIPDNYKDGTKNEDDTDFETVNVQGSFDLALKKYVKTKSNGTSIQELTGTEDRSVYTVENREEKNNHKVSVSKGDLVIFNIEVENQGKQDGTVTQIKDNLPKGLGYYIGYGSFEWTTTGNTAVSAQSLGLEKPQWYTGNDWNNVQIINGGDNVSITYDPDISLDKYGDSGDSATVQIPCIVTSVEDLTDGVIKNFAQISGHADSDNKSGDIDVDSKVNNYGTINRKIVINGYEDDEDFDVLVPRDIEIRKYVKKVNNDSSKGRTVSEGTITSVETINKDNPVDVEKDDVVTFGIRVYNEGNSKVTNVRVIDVIPEGLEFQKNSSNNSGWKIYKTTTNSSNADITYNGISYSEIDDDDEDSDVNMAMKIIPEIDGSTSTNLKYQELLIDLKVNTDETNVLENKAILIDENNKHDEDRVVPPGIYDLALQKFITKVNDKAITDREPIVVKDSKTGDLSYTEVTEPEIVFNGDIVEYTIRVYNEGNRDAYASQIIDDLPEGIKFLPNNSTNKEYEWKMYKEASSSDTDTITIKNNNVEKKYIQVDDINEANIIVTDYLKRKEVTENGTTTVTSPIAAYDKTEKIDDNNPDYQDIKVVFEVVQENATSSENTSTIINVATVTELTDTKGDVKPDKDYEDTYDDEFLRLTYFDLALLKYCSKVVVTEDGKTTETETGYNGYENPKPVAKVEINKKKIMTTDVRFVYTIEIVNQGEIEGFASEITDVIPEGLAFYIEDNKEYGWEIAEEGKVKTDYLAKELIKPGESKKIQITLRWENSETNMDKKINLAAITKDYNEYDAPDYDSKPGNFDESEDDTDTAEVILSPKTGSAPIYIGLIISSISLLGIGGFLIKKYVL